MLIWCDLNAESKALTKAVNGAVEVEGTMPLEEKEDGIVGFIDGKYRVMVTKPSVAAWGINAQNAHIEIFVGLSHSFEMYYQAVRRCWRFGQEYPVDVYVIISSAEGEIVKNIARKQADAERMIDELTAQTKERLISDLHSVKRENAEYYAFERMAIPEWLKTQAV